MIQIHELLETGADNATTARKLAQMLGCSPRDITQAIETERRAGAPICASCDGTNPGYFLPADTRELEDYCQSLERRAREINRTRRALLESLKKIRDSQEKEADKLC